MKSITPLLVVYATCWLSVENLGAYNDAALSPMQWVHMEGVQNSFDVV